MFFSLGRHHTLVPRGQSGLTVDQAGVALAGLPLVVRGQAGYGLASDAQLAKALDMAFGTETVIAAAGPILCDLTRIARALDSGNLLRAHLLALHSDLSCLPAEGMLRLAKYNHRHSPQDGRFISADAGEDAAPDAGSFGASLSDRPDQQDISYLVTPEDAIIPAASPDNREAWENLPKPPSEATPGELAEMRRNLKARPELSVNRKMWILTTFGLEGGMKSPAGGLLPTTKDTFNLRDPKNVADIIDDYQKFLDKGLLYRDGGVLAFDNIDNQVAATFLGDTLFLC